jgi:hypothetical protein
MLVKASLSAAYGTVNVAVPAVYLEARSWVKVADAPTWYVPAARFAGAWTVQVMVALRPGASVGTLIGADGVTVQPDGAAMLTCAPVTAPPAGLVSVPVTLTVSPPWRIVVGLLRARLTSSGGWGEPYVVPFHPGALTGATGTPPVYVP